MKRWLIGFFLLFSLVLAGLIGGAYFLLWTTGGAQWLLDKIPRQAHLNLQARTVTGKIAGDLRLEGVEARWPGGHLKIDLLETSFQPRQLLRGRLLFKQVSVTRVSLEEKQDPPEPLDLTLPAVNGLWTRLDLEVSSFRLEHLRYRFNEDPPLDIQKIGGRLAWKNGILAMDSLDLNLPAGQVEGRLALGLAIPSLGVDLRFLPEKTLPGADQIVLEARLKPGKGSEQLAGLMEVRSLSDSKARARFRSTLGITPHQIIFRNITLEEIGRQGQIQGQGRVTFQAIGTALTADLKLDSLDFSRELKFPARLSGSLHVEGAPDRFSGRLDLKNDVSTWQSFRWAGPFQGRRSGMELHLEQGAWLQGTVTGRIGVAWERGFSLEGAIKARGLRPERINPAGTGLVNLDLKGDLLRSENAPIRANLEGRLLESQWQGKQLQGEVSASLDQDLLFLRKATLQGRGFQVSASGVLSERLNVIARISDISSLIPSARGAGSGRGWIRWRDRKWAGQMTLQSRDCSWKNVSAGALDLEAAVDQTPADAAIGLTARITKGGYGALSVEALHLQIQGTLSQQEISLSLQTPQARAEARLEGTYRRPQWQGTLSALSGELPPGSPFRLKAPVDLVIGPDGLHLAPLVLMGTTGEDMTLAADVKFQPLSGTVQVDWQRFQLVRFRPWLEKFRPLGQTTGGLLARLGDQDRLELQLRAGLQGKFRAGSETLELKRGDFTLKWDDGGLRSTWDLALTDWGRLRGEAVSSAKGRLEIPDQGTFQAQVDGPDLGRFAPWMPKGLLARGRINGRAQGKWMAESRFNLEGDLKLTGGSIVWKDNATEIRAQVDQAALGIQWDPEALRGTLALNLDQYGKASGRFVLPLPARFPLKVQPAGKLQTNISGKFRESGLVTVLFPGAVRSSQGHLAWDVSAGGTWEKPILGGNLSLSRAGADIPALGLRLQDVSLQGTFKGDRLQIDSLTLRSGPGTLKGSADLTLKDWKISDLQGRLIGKNFQFINQPHFQALGSPDLVFSGAPDRIGVEGTVDIPEALITREPIPGIKKASPDVVIVGAPAPSPSGRPFPIQGWIDLIFGDKVRVKMEGLNTLLTGRLRMTLKDSRDITARGEIRADQGYYTVQGTRLDLSRGRLIFSGPPDNPGLDILALRTIRGRQRPEDYVDVVRAGVIVTGTARSPLVRLYSQPSLSETDILSYILFGRPLSRGTGQQDLAILGKAAQVLLGGREESVLLKKLDLDTLDIQSGGGDMSRSMVTVGKYLDPRLFLGLGGSLFSNTYQLILRYSLTPRLELETKGGTQSGGGIFYKVDFE